MTSLATVYDLFKASTGVQTDTRRLQKGQLYFALKGPRFDGNHFALDALKNGASACIVSDLTLAQQSHCFYVPNTLSCLQRLAHHHRGHLDFPVFGITGSNGKTSTKELLVAVLGQRYNLKATQGNLNNHIGVPLTLLSLQKDLDLAIVEMGANQPGDIKQLCQIANPTHGLITNIGLAHLQGFGSLEMTRHTKAALMYHVLHYQSQGFFFLNEEESSLKSIAVDHPRVISLAKDRLGKGVSMELSKISPTIELSLQNTLQSVTASSSLYGQHNVNNLLMAIGIGLHFNLDLEQIAAGIETYEPSDNRSQLLSFGALAVYLDAYNANPSSVSAAIDFFTELELKKKWLVLGDMLELGDEEESLHHEIATKADQEVFERVFLVGNAFAQVRKHFTQSDRLHFLSNTAELVAEFNKTQWTDETLYVKGSRGMQLERITESLIPAPK